jgi:hypothetical protein
LKPKHNNNARIPNVIKANIEKKLVQIQSSSNGRDVFVFPLA